MHHFTYVVNLPNRTDRREHIVRQFIDKPEFDMHIQEPIQHPVAPVSLWLTLRSIVTKEKEKGSTYFIFCEDDHTFTNDYSPTLLEKNIIQASKLQADVLLGGASWFDNGMKVDENLFWIHHFTGMQFTVIFNRFYNRLLEAEYDDNVITDLKISQLTDKKWMVYPHISIQTEFGYSDVTTKNGNSGFVDNLFKLAIARAETLDKVAKYFTSFHSQDNNDVLNEIPVDIAIPTYIINLKDRPDHLSHALLQFEDKIEFDIHVVEACKHQTRAVGLWKSIVRIIQEVVDAEEDDMIIICGDDHTFTANYNRDKFIRHIIKAGEQGCEILSGGIYGFGNAFPTGKERYWIDWFWSTQFMVIYRPIFGKILDVDFTEKDTVDGKLSEITRNKMTIHPFISIRRDLGYSDVSKSNNDIEGKIGEYFYETNKRLEYISEMLRYHHEIMKKN